MNNETRRSSWGVFLLGGVVGAAIGLLTAPRGGREFREFLRGAAEDMERVPRALRKAGSKIMKSGREAFQVARHEIAGADSKRRVIPRTSES